MLELMRIHLAFGGDVLFENIQGFIGERERVGLIGDNGTGKTTLFKVILGELTPDQGQVDKRKDMRIGILRQDIEFPEHTTLMDYIKSAMEDVQAIEQQIAHTQSLLESTDPDDHDAMTALAQDLYNLEENMRILDAGRLEAKAVKIALGLGYNEQQFDQDLSEFSGGWKMRAEIARLLLKAPDLLLLDEPTNHLDIYSIMWLEQWLTDYEGSVLFISHDKTFLDNVAKRIWHLQFRKLTEFTGSYSRYLEHSAMSQQHLLAAQANQEKRLQSMQRTVERFRAKASKARMAQSIEKMIEREERIEVDPLDSQAMRIVWPTFHPGGREIVTMKDISHAYDRALPVIDHVDLQILRGEKVAFVGKNGTGKSTMAKILTGQIRPQGGSVQYGVEASPYYFDQYASDRLDPKLSILETVEQAGSGLTTGELRSILGAFMFSGDDVHKKTKVLSGGEKNRLALALMILSKSNLLVLDEPTNHLDMKSREVLKEALLQYPGTLIVVSHDRTFLQELSQRTYFFDHGRVVNYLGDIDYVLEREKADDMRSLELNSTNTSSSSDQIPDKQSNKTDNSIENKSAAISKNQPIDRDLQKHLRRIENKIMKLEEQKHIIEADMAYPDFYEQSDVDNVIADYEQVKSELDMLTKEWESIAEQL